LNCQTAQTLGFCFSSGDQVLIGFEWVRELGMRHKRLHAVRVKMWTRFDFIDLINARKRQKMHTGFAFFAKQKLNLPHSTLFTSPT
jgi:hypothetical protein